MFNIGGTVRESGHEAMLVVLLGFEFVRLTMRDEAAGDNNTHSQTLKLDQAHDTMLLSNKKTSVRFI